MIICAESMTVAAGHIPNLRVVSDWLVRGGQPAPEALPILKKAGIKTIINLCGSSGLRGLFSKSAGLSCMEGPEVAEERRWAADAGVDFIALPVDVFRTPTEEVLAEFLQVIGDPEKRPIFIHCLHGRDRTGLMVGLYRIACENWDADRAYAEMLECGFDKQRTNLSDVLFAFAKRRVRE